MNTMVTVSDSIIRDTRLAGVVNCGRSFVVTTGAHAEIDRARIEIAAIGSILTADTGTSVAVNDSVLVASANPGSGQYGRPMVAGGGASVSATRVLIDGAYGVAVAERDPSTSLTLTDTAITNPTLLSSGTEGIGVQIETGSTASLERVVIDGAHTVSIFVDTGGHMAITESAIRNGLSNARGRYGRGLHVQAGGIVSMDRSLIANTREEAIEVTGSGTTMTANDVLLDGVVPSGGGFGLGLGAYNGAMVTANRLGVLHVAGAALAAVPDDGTMSGAQLPASLTVADLFVRDVATSTIRYSSDGSFTPQGEAVAYALHAGPTCSLSAQRAVLDNGGYGFFSASHSLSIESAVITRMTSAAGASQDPMSSATLQNVTMVDNAQNGVIVDSTLPTQSALPPPAPVCPPTGCM
jgi:hypothetical protein